MKLSDLKQNLADRRIQLTKSLGQSFLHDANQLRRMVEAAELGPRDKVVEIGPGLGPLTELLLEKAAPVLAIEKDARLVAVLRERFHLDCGDTPALELREDDALRFLRREAPDWHDWKLVANLPYSVASPILVELAQLRGGPQRIVVTLQLEVAKRLMAKAGEADYGVLTLLVQIAYEPVRWFKIPATCFFPEPAVDSACLCLTRRAPPFLSPALAASFARIVKRSFSQRRKMMRKLLRADFPAAAIDRAFALLSPAPLPAEARAESVTLEQFVRLTGLLSAP